jgi:chromosome segregation ATPase
LAGLFLFQNLGLRADLPPGRSAAPASSLSGQPAPEVRAADLKAVKDASEGAAKRASDALDEQARRLSRTAASLVELQAELKLQSQSSKGLDSSLAGLTVSLADLDKRVSALSQGAAAKEVDAASQAATLKKLGEDLAGLRNDLEGGAKQMRDGLAEIATLREDLKQRQARLDSLSDLLQVMKKDLDGNSEEIVELKQSVKRLEAAPAGPGAPEWWEQALTWKYLPAVAVGLSLVAVGLAAAHQ